MDVVVQRDREVAALTRQLERVVCGAGSVVVVEGPAGIGKSTLLGVTTRIAQASGVRVLRAWGSPLEYDAGWGIARQLMAPVRRAPEWDDLAIGAAALALGALDPQPERPLSAGDAMHAATHGLTWLAYGLAERAPTVLVIDDAHWADAQSLRWLTQLSRQVADLPLGLVCAVRSGERPADPKVLAEFVATASGPAVRPAPLDQDAVGAIVRSRWPTASRSFTQACRAATAGNPFLLRALLDALADDDLTPSDELAARLTEFGPAEVTRSVERQLSRLPDGSADLAHAIAVLDRNVTLRHAGEVARLDQARAARLADGLSAAGLVESGEAGYGLVHPLVASALSGGLPAGERAALHGRAAAVLHRHRADPETVALHLLHTEPYGRAETVALLRLAAEGASRRGAPDAAATFLRRALNEPPDDPGTEADLRSELGLTLAAQVRPGAGALLHQAADLAIAPRRRAELALSGARALGLAGFFDDAAQLCRRGHRPEEDVPADLLDRVEAELVGMCFLDARTIDEARRRLTTRCGGPRGEQPRLWPILAAWRTQFDARPIEETRALLALLPPEAMQEEPDSLICTIAKFVYIFCEDLDTACALCDGLIDLARPRGWQIALAHGSFIRASALVRAGRIREAVVDARSAFDFKIGNSSPAAIIWSLTSLVDALVELGELDEADAALRIAWEHGEPPPDGLGVPIVIESRARLRLAQGRYEEAIADLRMAAGMWERLQMQHPGLATWRVGMCQALVALGDRTTAERLAEEHRLLAEQVGLPGPRAAALHALATATGGQRAVALLEQARELVRDAPVRLEYVRTLVGLGAALRRANRRTDARDALREALDLAEHGGMRLLAHRARQELAATGARPRRNRTSGVDALTPAEHRVAALAAQGRSNPEIAQELFVTRRTVETHLTHAFTKLDIAARSELADALAGARLARRS
jgi:DNA-binding CsgD family transcriptional regulator